MKKGLLYLVIFLSVSSGLEAQNHFATVWSGNGVDHMNFYVTKATIEDHNMQAGDEISIFDGSFCVGVEALTEEIIEGSNYLSIVTSKNDAIPPEINGYTPGSTVIIKIWDDSEQEEISDIETTYLTGEAIFSIGGTASFKLNGSINSENIPIANAGADRQVNEGDEVELDGSESSDPLNANLTYSWTTNSGIILNNPITATPSFTAPEVEENTLYEFYLIVNNGNSNSEHDTIVITVLNVNKIPVITGQSIISTDEEIPVNISVNDLIIDDLDNTYPDDFTLSLGQGDNYTISDNELMPILDFFGTLIVPVVVSDGIDESDPFNIIITVNNINDAPQFTSFPKDTTIYRNSPTLFKIDATDVDSEDSLYFTVSFNPYISEHNLTIIDLGKAELTITPTDYDESPVDVTVTLTDSIILVPVEISFRLDFTPTGMQYLEEFNSLIIYPNPTKNHLFIHTGDYSKMSGYHLKIINELGSAVFDTEVEVQLFEVDLSTWTGTGLYFVQVIDSGGNVIETKKIILN